MHLPRTLAEIAAREADVLWVTDENPRTEDPQKALPAAGIASGRRHRAAATVRRAILAAEPGDVIITGKRAPSGTREKSRTHHHMMRLVAEVSPARAARM